NQSQIIAEQIIPENEGGFWIREIGLYDDEGVLIAVANCPETYKPQLQEGSGRTQTIRMILVVTNTEAITLKIDPSVVLATRKYVDDEVLELRLYVDDQMRNHIAAQDPHTQYAQKHNPTFTGEPKAPTPDAGNNTTRIATTAFVQAAITALINGAPATLDTLKEIAAAINNDPKFSTTINNALSGKQPLDETLTHLSGKDVAGLLAYLGLGEGAPAIGVPFFWPSAAMPDTVIDSWSGMVFLKFNGAKFSATDYPVLAKVFPALALPDARGDFIRIWDDGRGIDVGRTLLSGQSHTIMDHAHNMELWTGDGLAAGSAREGVNPGILATYGDGGIVKTDEPGLRVPSSLRALSSRSVKRYGEISGHVGTETRPRNIAFNFLVRAK
ncbi:TPA: phage tail protein, partial [Escherichia coli]|nr:phage tail protein [Escherichia coli]